MAKEGNGGSHEITIDISDASGLVATVRRSLNWLSRAIFRKPRSVGEGVGGHCPIPNSPSLWVLWKAGKVSVVSDLS
jgi:hypothetical protein